MIGVAVTAMMVSAVVLPSGWAMAFAVGTELHPAVGVLLLIIEVLPLRLSRHC
jgi:hypothetical protein